MEKIKVLMIGNHQSVKGGITSVIQQLLSFDWDSAGVEMKFIPTYIEASGIKKIAYFIRAYMNIEKAMRTNKPDVVHIHMSYRGSFYRKYAIHNLCKKYGVPDVIHLHGSEFQKWYNESDDKSWNGDTFQLLFLGVLIKRKGVADLIQAISLLKKEGRLNNLKFIIAGSGSEEENLKQQASELQVEHWIEFAGWTDGKAKERYLKESQALVLPSYNEGLPIAVLEAISYGLPVIATDVGDMAAAVREGENGFLIKPGDVSALADKIKKITEDKGRYNQMSTKSKEIALTEFSDRKYFEKIYNCYREAVYNR